MRASAAQVNAGDPPLTFMWPFRVRPSVQPGRARDLRRDRDGHARPSAPRLSLFFFFFHFTFLILPLRNYSLLQHVVFFNLFTHGRSIIRMHARVLSEKKRKMNKTKREITSRSAPRHARAGWRRNSSLLSGGLNKFIRSRPERGDRSCSLMIRVCLIRTIRLSDLMSRT